MRKNTEASAPNTVGQQKKRWPWIVGAGAAVAIFAASCSAGSDTVTNSPSAGSGSGQSTSQPVAPAETKPAEAEGTTSQKNALRAAESYLRFSAFSHSGLVKQLEFEKYPEADAIWAADHVNVDWNEQAVKSAKSYLKFTAFSHDGLVEQLMYSGFTAEQAEHGVTQAGL